MKKVLLICCSIIMMSCMMSCSDYKQSQQDIAENADRIAKSDSIIADNTGKIAKSDSIIAKNTGRIADILANEILGETDVDYDGYCGRIDYSASPTQWNKTPISKKEFNQFAEATKFQSTVRLGNRRITAINGILVVTGINVVTGVNSFESTQSVIWYTYTDNGSSYESRLLLIGEYACDEQAKSELMTHINEQSGCCKSNCPVLYGGGLQTEQNVAKSATRSSKPCKPCGDNGGVFHSGGDSGITSTPTGSNRKF